MAVVDVSVSQVLKQFEKVYKSIDIRSAAWKEKEECKNLLTVLRFSNEEIKTNTEKPLRIEKNGFFVVKQFYPFSILPTLSEQFREGKVKVQDIEVVFGRSIDFLPIKGSIEGYAKLTRKSDENNWFLLEVTDGKQLSQDFYNQGVITAVKNLGYDDVKQAVNHLLETNFNSSSNSFDFIVSVPVYITFENIVFENSVLKVSLLCDCNIAKNPSVFLLLKERKTNSLKSDGLFEIEIHELDTPEKNFKILAGEVSLPHVTEEDVVELSSTYGELSEICRIREPVKELLKPQEVNPLFIVLKQFCSEEKLKKLLLEPQTIETNRGKKQFSSNQGRLFERSISWLLSMLGFSTILLGEYEELKEKTQNIYGSVDILAYRRRKHIFLLVNCTMKPPDDNEISKTNEVAERLRREFFEDTKTRVLPVVFSVAETKIGNKSVRIFGKREINLIYNLINQRREDRFLDHLLDPLLFPLKIE